MMKRILCLALCAAMVLPLFGCGTGDSAYVPTGNGLTWDDPTAPIATAPTQAPEIQQITMGFYPGESFNPLISTDLTNRMLIPLIYQGLFTIDRNYEVKPLLCKSYTMTEDMRTYLFYLEDATFSDGSRLEARDVVATLNAAMESPVYQGRFRYVDEITATPDGGVMVRLTTAYENFPILLDIPILKAEELERDRPLGTGPYRLDATTDGMRLTRRIEWWCKASLPIKPDTIRLIAAEDAVHIRDEFEFGDINLVCANPCSNDYADYRCDYELWDCEGGVFVYLACNLESPVFEIQEVRAALTHAIDRDQLAADHYRGFARMATLPASPLSPYYNAGLAARYGYNPTRFAQAVITAQRAGFEVTLLVNRDDTIRLQVARDIGDMLEECGLTVLMSELDTEAYQKALRRGEYDLYLGQTKLSPNMDLSAFFSHDGALRYGGLSNVALNALCQEALANRGNYYNLHQQVAEEGSITAIGFLNYALYADRGLLSGISPSRDNAFYYDLGRTMEDARNAYNSVPAPTVPEETVADITE